MVKLVIAVVTVVESETFAVETTFVVGPPVPV
jgi:hypothetical protein